MFRAELPEEPAETPKVRCVLMCTLPVSILQATTCTNTSEVVAREAVLSQVRL
jgi:hypothetical protein